MSEPAEQQTSQPQQPKPTETADKSLVGSAPAGEDTAAPAGEDTVAAESEAAPAPEPLTRETLTLPEGMTASDEILDGFVETMNNADLPPQERATALLDLHNKLLEQSATQMTEAWQTTQEEWRQAARDLPEIGGANLDQTLGGVAAVVDRYGGKEAREAFDLTGAGNHPAVIKLLANIAKDLNEQPPVSGSPPQGAPKSRAEIMFGGTS